MSPVRLFVKKDNSQNYCDKEMSLIDFFYLCIDTRRIIISCPFKAVARLNVRDWLLSG